MWCRDIVTYRLEVRFKAYCRGWVMALYLSKLMTQRLTILAVQHITSMDTQKSQNLRPNLHPPTEKNIGTLILEITEPPPKPPPTYREKHRNINTQRSQNLRPNLHPPTKRNIETLTPRNHRTSAQISIHLQREIQKY